MDGEGFGDVAQRGLVLLGCGRMGSALLRGWLAGGIPAGSVHVIDPAPSDWLHGTGVALGGSGPARPAVVVVAVKPQMMDTSLSGVAHHGGGGALFLSVAAGTPIRWFESRLGAATPLVRAMPNTPAAIGHGITAIVGNAAASRALPLAAALMESVGQVVQLDDEAQIDAVTGVSGSGPAYVFHLIEALADAGVAQGLPPEMALTLARATVAGAGRLAMAPGADPAQLRRDVTSPAGTTQAGLEVLMDADNGLRPLISRTVAAAVARSRTLAGG